jgi:hypothetical protein
MNYDYGIPDYARVEFEAYRAGNHPYPFGDFLRSVLANDLCGAAGRADDQNIRLLDKYAAYLYNELPGRSGNPETDYWGSYEAVDRRIAEQREKAEATA